MGKKIPTYINCDTISQQSDIQKKEMFTTKRGALNELIDKDIKREKNPLRLKVLNEIRSLPSYTEDDYTIKHFLYNNGEFRTKEEIDEYNRNVEKEEAFKRLRQRQEEDRNYYRSGQYREECNKGTIACWTPVFIYLGLFLIGLFDFDACFNMLVFLFFTSPLPFVITLIWQYKHAKHCEELAVRHNIPKSDSDYQKAVLTARTAKIGLIAAAATALHEGGKAIKSIENPESWNVLN